MQGYTFPAHRLSPLSDATRTPVVLVACGSFSPITYAHLRMFEMARDFARQGAEDKSCSGVRLRRDSSGASSDSRGLGSGRTTSEPVDERDAFEIVGGYLSPVSDQYRKAGLLSSDRRVTMCSMACELTSNWLMCDTWEAFQTEYQRSAVVLDHFHHEINTVRGGVPAPDGTMRPVRIMLLAGSDLIHTMAEPGVWSSADVSRILGHHGTFIVERSGASVDDALQLPALAPYLRNIIVLRQMIQNDVSSTKIRLFLRRGMSVRYLLPSCVEKYIDEHGLYREEPATRQAAFSDDACAKIASSSAR